MPFLLGEPTILMPTIGMQLEAELCLDGVALGVVSTRYQIQSWRGSEKRETRVTGKLTSLLGGAKESDLLIISRKRNKDDCYRLDLIPKRSKNFRYFMKLVSGRRWGALEKNDPPESFALALESALQEEEERAVLEFSLFDFNKKNVTSVVTKKARDYAFKRRVLKAYGWRCAICAKGFKSPDGQYELEAAHIVPHSMSGVDDVRNGFSLCRSHHWAFDRGLFGITAKRTVYVPDVVKEITQNSELCLRHQKKLFEPLSEGLRVDASAFAWHWENILIS
ncbi:hypothetical protein AXG94_08550 [Pseudomonas corrugata]|nr:hypothetical protein AXG94_08550 [Pseudomonas corrugata]